MQPGALNVSLYGTRYHSLAIPAEVQTAALGIGPTAVLDIRGDQEATVTVSGRVTCGHFVTATHNSSPVLQC